MNGLGKAFMPSRLPILSDTTKWTQNGHIALARLGWTGSIKKSEIMSTTMSSCRSTTSGFRSSAVCGGREISN